MTQAIRYEITVRQLQTSERTKVATRNIRVSVEYESEEEVSQPAIPSPVKPKIVEPADSEMGEE
jgi:hypothetical protein